MAWKSRSHQELQLYESQKHTLVLNYMWITFGKQPQMIFCCSEQPLGYFGEVTRIRSKKSVSKAKKPKPMAIREKRLPRRREATRPLRGVGNIHVCCFLGRNELFKYEFNTYLLFFFQSISLFRVFYRIISGVKKP